MGKRWGAWFAAVRSVLDVCPVCDSLDSCLCALCYVSLDLLSRSARMLCISLLYNRDARSRSVPLARGRAVGPSLPMIGKTRA